MWICRILPEHDVYMSTYAFTMLVCTLLAARPLVAETIPFDICAESTTWTRPTPEVQAKIWNDGRYGDEARTAYDWTHNFLVSDPESASIPYHMANISGLWTARTNPGLPAASPSPDPTRNRILSLFIKNSFKRNPLA